MLFLTGTGESFTLVTGAALSTDWSVGYVDMDTTTGATAGSGQNNVASATTTTIVSAPGASVQRQLKSLTVTNKDGASNQTVTLNKVTGAGTYAICRNVLLTPNQELVYIDSIGFKIYAAGLEVVGASTVTLTGDVTGSGSSSIATTIPNGTVTLAKQANLAANSIQGNNTGGAAIPLALTGTQVTAMLDNFTSGLKGLAPSSGGGSTNFLRADGTWNVPATGNAPTITLADDVANASDYLTFSNGATGAQAIKTTAGVRVNPSTNTITATTFSGALSGNATSATSATNTTNSAITDDTSTSAVMYPVWVTANTGNLPLKVSSTELTWNPGTNTFGLVGADTGIQLTGITNEPAAAPASNLRIYSKSIAGRMQPKWIGSAGVDYVVQPSFSNNNIRVWKGAATIVATTFATNIGTMPYTGASPTAPTIPALASTNLLTQTRRSTISTGASAGALAYIRANQTECWRGNAAGLGGYYAVFRFALSTLQTGMRVFVGLGDTVANPTNVDPTTSTTIGKMGLAINASTGNWNFVTNVAASAPTITALGANFPVNTTALLELVLFAAPNDANVGYRVTNWSTNQQTSGTVTTNFPANTTFLIPQMWCTNNATAAAVTLDFISTYLETDY